MPEENCDKKPLESANVLLENHSERLQYCDKTRIDSHLWSTEVSTGIPDRTCSCLFQCIKCSQCYYFDEGAVDVAIQQSTQQLLIRSTLFPQRNPQNSSQIAYEPARCFTLYHCLIEKFGVLERRRWNFCVPALDQIRRERNACWKLGGDAGMLHVFVEMIFEGEFSDRNVDRMYK